MAGRAAAPSDKSTPVACALPVSLPLIPGQGFTCSDGCFGQTPVSPAFRLPSPGDLPIA